MDELIQFTCPRCNTEVSVEYYGPCDTCRQTLRATVLGAAEPAPAVADTAFEPKMNVTPNAVAVKE